MAIKNALQSVMDSIKSGAVKFAGQTPIGQLVTKMGQVSQPLRVPTMQELTNSYNQTVGRVSSFVQQNPSPASFVVRQVPQITQAPLRVTAPKAYQTFQENMRLLSRPMESLTTETPAARFLINRIGGPASDLSGNFPGPRTVGNYLASNIEASLPGLLPMMGVRTTPEANILKQGVNIPAAFRSGAGLTAFSVGLRALKGEKATPADLASSFAIGAMFGIAEPKPMPGLAPTELGAARDVLGKYGFKLSDYENPALLRAKLRRVALDLHPDKFFVKDSAGNFVPGPLAEQKSQEFAAFIDAYNKATSAGIDAAWKLPDIMAWIRNLWTKKQQPKPTGLRIAQQSVVPGTATQQLFGKIADVVRAQSGVGSHIFEGSQIRTVLKKSGLDTLPEGTVDAPGFVIQYMRKDPVTGQPIVPRLVVNIIPQEAAVAAQSATPIPTPVISPQVQAPVVTAPTPIKPPTVTTAPQVAAPVVTPPKGTKTVPYEPLSMGSLDYIREMRRLVNVSELQKMTKMSNAEINGYVTKLFPTPPSTGGEITQTEGQKIFNNLSKEDLKTYGNKTPEVGKSMFGGESGTGVTLAQNAPKELDQIGILAQASKDIKVRRDARKVIQLLSDRITDETSRVPRLQELKNNLESAGTPEGNIISNAIDKMVGGEIPKGGVTDIAYQNTIKNGGVTIDLGGNQPTQGFSYSPYPELQTIVPKDKFTEKNLQDFEVKNQELLSQPGHFIGTWEEKGQIYMDVSVVGAPTAETLQKAMNATQLGVFDLTSLAGGWDGNITLGKFDKKVYNPIDEAINIFDQYTRKTSGAGGQEVVAGVPEVPQSVPEAKPSQEVTIPLVSSGAVETLLTPSSIPSTPPAQAPPTTSPPATPIVDILEQAKQQKIAQEARPKFFNLLDKIKFQVLSDLHPAALLDRLVGQAGGLTHYEAQMILNRGRIRGSQDLQDELFKKNLTSSGMVNWKGQIDSNLEVFLRANQYIYRETVLTKRAEAMVKSKNEKIRQQGEELMTNIRESRINEGNQTAESAKAEIEKLKGQVTPERFDQIQSAATKIWDQLKDAFTAKYKAGLVKKKTYTEVMSRDPGYAPYAVLQYEKTTKDGGIRADGRPVRTMWGTTEIQENPIKAAYYAIINAQSLVYTNLANREPYKAIKFVPEWVRPARMGERPPDGFTALNIYNKGVKKTIYVPNEIASMWEYSPLSDKTLTKLIRYTLGATKGVFVWFVTGVRPVFTLVNKIGDLMRFAIWSKGGVTLTNPVATTIFLADTINGFVQSTLSELPSGRFITPRVRALKARGVLQSTFTSSLADFGPDYSLGFKMSGLGKKSLDFVNQLLLYINYVAEKSTKVTSDIRLERMGMEQIARDVESREYGGSPDFQQLGNLIRRAYLNRVFVFVNPAIQGPRLDIRRTVEGGWKGNADSRKARLRIITNIVIPAILIYYLQQLPDWKKDYDELKKNNPLLFENNWVIPTPFKGTRADGSYGWKYTLIPLRDTQQNINVLVDGLLDIMRDRTPQVFQDSLYKTIMTWSPFRTQISNISQARGFLGKVGTVVTDVGFGVMAALNPALRLLPEQIGNIKFYQRTPIVSAYLANKLPPDQWTPMTPDIYKMLGERFGMSPVRIQYFLEQTGGSVPTDFVRMFGQAVPSMSDEEKYLSDPIIRRFVGVVTSSREADVEKFFTATDQIAKTYQSYLFRARSQADMAQAQAFLDAHPELMYRKAIASMAARMNDVYASERKVRYNVNLSDQDKRTMIANLESQKQGILDMFSIMWNQVEALSTGKPLPTSQTLLQKAQAAETTPTATISIKSPTQVPIRIDSNTAIRDLLKTTSRYSDIRSFFDMALETGQPFDAARKMAQSQGIDPDLAEYDFWSAQNARVRALRVNDLIQGLDQGSIWDVFISLRKESPGTGNMVLTDTLITDLINDGTISKDTGKALKKVKFDSTGQPIAAPVATGTSAATKAAITKLTTLMKQRDAAYMKALKVKTPSKSVGIKVKLPKVKLFTPLKVTISKSTPVKFKLPTIKPIRIPISLKGLIRGNPRFY